MQHPSPAVMATCRQKAEAALRRAEELSVLEAVLIEEEIKRRLERHVLVRVAEVMASDAVQQSLSARLVQERQVCPCISRNQM